jgi:hypothetical protein
LDGADVSNDFIGIDTGLGRGFVIEENSLANLQTAIQLADVPAIDLIIWDNEFNIVQTGLNMTRTSATTTVGRIIAIENAIDLARDLNSIAMRVTGSPGTGIYFEQFIARKNIIRADPVSMGSTALLKGLAVENVRNAIVENNVISDCENGPTGPLSFHYCTTTKAFNNQDGGGTLLRAYDVANSRYLLELEDFCEDSLLGF